MSEKDDFYKDLLTEVFDVGVLAAQPDQALKEAWQEQIMPWLSQLAPERERVWVFGAGKAAASMAKALEGVVGSTEKLQGFVVTRRGHEVKTSTIEVVQAAHPVPDEDGQRAARRLHKAISEVPSSDAVIALVSGGGSSLLSVPVRDIPFVDLQQLNRALLACGAPIDEMNIVRKHVTQTLGGQLAQICRAPVFQLLISDVPGDDPSSIASGPFSPDESTFHDAMEVIKRWAVQVPHSIARYLEKGVKGTVPDTPKRSSLVFRKVKTHLLASNLKSLNAVTQHLEGKGYKVLNHVRVIQGDGINPSSIRAILERITSAGYATDNLAFGMGGALLQRLDRDTQKFALKCSAARVDGEWIDVYKDPVTDKGKQSKRGRMTLLRHREYGGFRTVPVPASAASLDDVERPAGYDDAMVTVWEDGRLLRDWTLAEIRARADAARL